MCGMNPYLLTLHLFGEYNCYNAKDMEFFLGVYFFDAPCISAVKRLKFTVRLMDNTFWHCYTCWLLENRYLHE